MTVSGIHSLHQPSPARL